MKILIFLLSAFLLFEVVIFLRLFVKRMTLILRLKKLKRESNLKIEFLTNPFLTLFGMRKKADIAIEISDTVYLVRFYNGKGRFTQVHFANDEYTATFLLLKISTFGSGRWMGRNTSRGSRGNITTTMRRVKIIPILELSEEYGKISCKGKNTVPVFLFNPAPSAVTYVTNEGTSIKSAFAGDSMRGSLIFTASSFISFLERELEEEKTTYCERIFDDAQH